MNMAKEYKVTAHVFDTKTGISRPYEELTEEEKQDLAALLTLNVNRALNPEIFNNVQLVNPRTGKVLG